jgi:Protein of unknown function (DUF2997)
MTSRIIEVIISPQGETRIETKGFSGSSCQLASQFLEEALGARQMEQLTSEFYQSSLDVVRAQQGGTL